MVLLKTSRSEIERTLSIVYYSTGDAYINIEPRLSLHTTKAMFDINVQQTAGEGVRLPLLRFVQAYFVFIAVIKPMHIALTAESTVAIDGCYMARR